MYLFCVWFYLPYDYTAIAVINLKQGQLHTLFYFFQEQIFFVTLQAMLSWVILVPANGFKQFVYLVREWSLLQELHTGWVQKWLVGKDTEEKQIFGKSYIIFHLERIGNNFLHTILAAVKCTHNAALRLGLGLITMETRIWFMKIIYYFRLKYQQSGFIPDLCMINTQI